MNVHRPSRTVKVDLRLSPDAKRTLQLAAAAARRSLSEFVLESALDRAEEQLPDRTRFTLDAARWRAFTQALDGPPRENDKLERLIAKPSLLERP